MMIKKLITAFFTITVIFSAPVYPEGLTDEVSEYPSEKYVYVNIALEWLRGKVELPVEKKEIKISVPLAKNDEEVVNEAFQLNAISHVLKYHNRYLDSTTASEYAKIIKSTSEEYGEDPFVIAALIVVESRAKHDARSKGGDFGLMQVRWRVHKNKLTQKFPTIKTESDMFKPVENILAGTEILSNYKKYANGDIEIAMKAYSGGSSSHWEKVFRVVNQMRIKYNEFSKGVV